MCAVRLFFLTLFLTVHEFSAQQCDPSWNRPNRNNDMKNYYLHHHRHLQHGSEVQDGTGSDTLRLVHVLFRHGDRTPDPDALYPRDPYVNLTYYPVGLGQLTNLGKKQEYQIGKSLRKRYNYFLGDIYTAEALEALSTDVNRTKMSIELVLAGLWPPAKEQIWNNELPWLAIPYNYYPAAQDRILGDPNVVCPKYKKLYNQNLLTHKNLKDNEELRSFYSYISYHMGLNFTNPMDVYNIYFTLRAEEGLGLELPAWTKCVWPHKFLDVALKQYELFTDTPQLTGLSAGLLLDKIIKDSRFRMKNVSASSRRKIHLYSGHERNIALTLIGLGVYTPHMPPYASYIIIELHEVRGVYGFKVFYQDYTEGQPKLMTVPGCESFCEFDKFYRIIYLNLPHESCDLYFNS